MIVIVDYGMGNLRSIYKKLELVKIESVISADVSVIKKAKGLILPGVGFFGQGMRNLQTKKLIPVLTDQVLNKKIPILGICLGMQLLADYSEEGSSPGLGWIKGKVVKFNFNPTVKLRVPHVGWNVVNLKNPSPLFTGIPNNTRFYFTHSYYFDCQSEDNITTTTDYGLDFPSAIQKNNIFGVQFHPEKSHLTGLTIFKNFATSICHA